MNIQHHLDRYKYSKGQFKGDAPADPTLRHKSHFRVLADARRVRFHGTDILTLTDSTVHLDAGGWVSSPTTRDALRFAVHRFTNIRGFYIHRPSVPSQRDIPNQHLLAYTRPDGSKVHTCWHDNLAIDLTTLLPINPMPIMYRRADLSARRAARAAMHTFLQALPILTMPTLDAATRAAAHHALPREVMQAIANPTPICSRVLREAASDLTRADLWPHMATCLAIYHTRLDTPAELRSYFARIAVLDLTIDAPVPTHD